MTLFTFTADATTDQIAATAHGLLTGDGPCAVLNVGGALPGGLAGGATDYWVIKVDADHLKLATSNALALAGTAIDLTTNGTGVQQLAIGLPFRRPRTYAAGSQIKSADLNAIFDCIKGGKLGPFTRNQTVRLADSGSGAWVPLVSAGDIVIASTGAGTGIIAIDVEEGDTLTGLVISVNGNGVTDTIFNVNLLDPDMATVANITAGGGLTDVNRAAGAYANLTIGLDGPHTIGAGFAVNLSANANGGAYHIGNIRVSGYRV